MNICNTRRYNIGDACVLKNQHTRLELNYVTPQVGWNYISECFIDKVEEFLSKEQILQVLNTTIIGTPI
jgi:hypothetical protein